MASEGSKYPVASEILDVRVDWMDGYGNSPSWALLLNSPQHPNFFAYDGLENPVTTWEHRNGLYRAESGMFVNFKAYSGPSDGYGGASMPIILADGEKLVMKGPWSSRAGCANQLFPERDRCVEFSTPYASTPEGLKEDWKRPYFGGLGGIAIKANVLIAWLRERDWVCQHLHNVLDDGRRTNNHTLTNEKVRVAWEYRDNEPVLIPLDYKTGKPKDALRKNERLEEVT